MPEGQVPVGAPAPAAEAPASGGGVAEAIVETDKNLAAMAKAAESNPEFPPEAKEALLAARDAFRAFVSAVTGGGEGPQGPAAVSPEAGANPNAVPQTMGRR